MDKLKEHFIALIQGYISEDPNLKDRIMDVLDITNDGLYRRLRGDVNFSFEEVVKLASELGFSIDNFIGLYKQNVTQFRLPFWKKEDIQETIQARIAQNILLLKKIELSKSSKVKLAINSLPLAIYSQYEYLFRFLMYKWTYQTQKVSPDFSFSDFSVSKKMSEDMKRYAYYTNNKSHLTYIIDKDVYKSIILDIEFFFKQNLIDRETLNHLSKELHETLNMLENFSITGVRQGKGRIDIYISSITVDRNYVYVESDFFSFCEFVIYSLNTLNTSDPIVGKMQDYWIESYKKFSTLITQCNEPQRNNYFKAQRELINELTKKYD